ncbi:MAG: dimethylsulfonioproprionate lyase family protein [Gammaproteobacteria bacterium]
MNNIFFNTPFSLPSETMLNPETGWRSLREGVTLRLLFQDPNSGYQVALIRYEPGASVPRHLHAGDEHIYVLSGSQQDERGHYGAGSYIYNPQGTRHGVMSQEGCLVLAHWLKPVQFLTE